MDTVLGFLWRRHFGSLNNDDFVEWAVHLLTEGHESDAILRLAGGAHLDVETRDRLFKQALREFGADELGEEQLLDWKEGTLLQEYTGGTIDARQFIEQVSHIARDSGYSRRYELWMQLDEDLAVAEDGYRPIFTCLDAGNLDDSLRQILINAGKVEP